MPKPRQSPVIEFIARGLWLHRGRLLLCQNRRLGHVFLPGGHVEFGEPAAHALKRELREELGARVQVGAMLAGVEASFQQRSGKTSRGGRLHHEINFIFPIQSQRPPAPSPGSNDVVAREDHLRFFWCPVEVTLGDDPQVLVLPRLMPTVLASLLTHKPGRWRLASPAPSIYWSDWPASI